VYRSWRGQVEQADTSAPSLVKAEINRPGEPVDRDLPSLDRVYKVRDDGAAGRCKGRSRCLRTPRAGSFHAKPDVACRRSTPRTSNGHAQSRSRNRASWRCKQPDVAASQPYSAARAGRPGKGSVYGDRAADRQPATVRPNRAAVEGPSAAPGDSCCQHSTSGRPLSRSPRGMTGGTWGSAR
jgi:hypothetical protein